jgi:hypothetical protein
MKHAIQIALSIVILLIAAFIGVFVLMSIRERQFRLIFPDANEATLIIKPAHMFLAEYDYRVMVKTSTHGTAAVDLYQQTGGRNSVLITWFPKVGTQGPFVRFLHLADSRVATEFIDMKTGDAYRNICEATIRSTDREYDALRTNLAKAKGVPIGYIDGDIEMRKPPSRNQSNKNNNAEKKRR